MRPGPLSLALLLAVGTGVLAEQAPAKNPKAIGPKPDDPRQAKDAKAIGPKPDDPRQVKNPKAIGPKPDDPRDKKPAAPAKR